MGEENLEIKEGLEIPGWELWFTASRSGGPGGQHANKVSSQVTVHWSVRDSSVFSEQQKQQIESRLQTYTSEDGVVQITANDTRSQHQNKKIARDRLAWQIGRALKRKKRRIATKPTRASQRRRIAEKRARGDLKELRKGPKKGDW